MAPWAFPSATAEDTSWEMASSKSAIAKLLENMDGTAAWKQSERFLSPVDLQIVTLFLQGKQNLIQLYKGVEAPKHLVGRF